MLSVWFGDITYLIMSDRTHYNTTYHIISEDAPVSRTPQTPLAWEWIIRGCARTCLHTSKGVCRSQAPDHWFVKPVFFWLLVSNEYASGKCIGVKVYILIRKCSGVKVGWNIKTQVKYRYSPKYLSTVMKYYYFVTLHHCFLWVLLAI